MDDKNNKDYNFYVTACGKKDGFGSQSLSKILAFLFCKYNNYTYIHSPLNDIEVKHKNIIQDKIGYQHYLNGKSKLWNNLWDNMLNISNDFIYNHTFDMIVDITNVSKTGQISIKNNYLWHDFNPNNIIKKYKIEKYKNKKILFKIKEFPKIDKYDNLFCEKNINILRNQFNYNFLENLLFEKNSFNIVVHKRMTGPYKFNKNVDFNNPNCRVTLNEHFISLFNKLYIKHKNNNPKFWIFSDGDINDFNELEIINNRDNHLNNTDTKVCKIKNNTNDFNINLLLQYNSHSTFQHFVLADVLILDKSSFGYVAGIYNKNTVIYNPYWDKKKFDWLIANEI